MKLFQLQQFKGLTGLGIVAVLATAGCGRDSVQVYNVDTNETVAASLPPPATAPAAMPGGMPSEMPPGMPTPDTAGLPSLKFTVPTGWQEKPASQMRVASFSVTEGGKQADVSVVPLGGMGGGDLANVNRWRGQISQPPLADEDLQKLAEPVPVAGQAAELFDLAGADTEGAPSERILGTILHRGDTVWFFKMTGDAALVEKQKAAFVDFLKSIQFGDAVAAAPSMGDVSQLPPSHPPIDGMGSLPPGAPTAPAGAVPAWTVPTGWQTGPLSQFLVAKFIITDANNARADVNVSSLAGDGGGLLANLNRWRQQLGQAPIADVTAANPQAVTVAGGQATLVDFTGVNARTGLPARLVGVIQSVGGQTWFFKLMGDANIVAAQKDALVKFVQSVRYPGAS